MIFLKNQYLEKINPVLDEPVFVKMRKLAEEQNIPIITEDGIHLLLQLVQIGKVKRVLEIGTAIAYTCIVLSKTSNIEVVSIERNPEMITYAKSFISEAGVSSKVTVIDGDALEIDEEKLGMFDLIFIDAAKAQYIKFFEKYEKTLLKGGVIVTDNLLFHGQVEDPSGIISKNHKQLVRKISHFNEWIVSQEGYNSHIYEIGDGMGISIKK